MAPELALKRLPRRLDRKIRVLDPMMGSGTIPVLAALQGYRAVGFDSDPLAVIIARTNGRPIDEQEVLSAAERVATFARASSATRYVHADAETQDFIDYWFDEKAQGRLGALAAAITECGDDVADPLWCGFSRLIVTKDAGASRARDVSHSRPHRVRDVASFDPIERFEGAVRAVVQRHRQVAPKRPADGRLRLGRGDARDLPIRSNSIDLVMTSPPYLQAIDYLRGHRMSLVWMGYTIGELRELRGDSIGTERGSDLETRHKALIRRTAKDVISPRSTRIIARYLTDLGSVLTEVARVLKPDGRATFVVADATIEGKPVSICHITKGLAKLAGLRTVEQQRREIPTARRYLPPPTAGGGNTLDKRMRVEHCLTFALNS
jgi:hypothetical protein